MQIIKLTKKAMTNIERNRQIASEIVARHNQRKAELTEQGIDTTITITSEDIKQIKARAKEQVINTNTMSTTIQTIDINAKQWFDKINGNSYFSAIITINYGMEGESTIKVPFEYGYGDYYRFAAYKAIKEQYPELKDIPMGYLSEHGIIIRSNIQKNCLKREVKEWGQNTNK